MPLSVEDLTALVQQLHSLSNSEQEASAVSVKIPQFWTSRPEVWFVQTEAQFSTKHITAESTKYNHVIAALDKSVAEEISAFTCSPPATNKYSAVKEILISIYGLTQTDKDARLLAISGLGDQKPTVLLRYMDSLTAPEDRKTTIYRALFLSHLPEAIRAILARNPPADLVDLAKAADDILAVQSDKTLCST